MSVRWYLLLAALVCRAVWCRAQPDPPSFCFVVAEYGAVVRSIGNDLRVVQHYRERVDYMGANGTWLKPEETLPLQGGPLQGDRTQGWTVYHPREGMAESFVLIIHRKDTMRIDLPEDPKALIDRAWQRADRDTPDVLRFRKGHFTIAELVADPWETATTIELAQQLTAAHEAAYQKQLAALEQYYRDQPPPPVPAPPPLIQPPMTEKDWEVMWAQQPPLKDVRLDRVSADTVWVKISGRVMLNGGCGSGMPVFGIEMLTDTGWAERIPFDLTQMDCGMPWADWEERVVMLPPLRWWIGVHQPEGMKAMRPGRYRIVLMGGDRTRRWTEPFLMSGVGR